MTLLNRYRYFKPPLVHALVWLCTTVFTDQAQSQQKQLLITTESSIPFNMSIDDGQTVIGITADKVHEILRRSQIPYQMQILSWHRAYELARTQPDTCVFETARTDDREASFKWIGPLSKGDWGIYGSPDKVGKVTKLSDLQGASIGGYKGDALGEYLTQQGYHVVNSYDDQTTLKNLLIGRLDFWTSDTTQAPRMIAANKVQGKVVLLFTYGASEYYLACNPAVRDEWVEALRTKLKEIKIDGTEAKIEAKYQHYVVR